MSQGGGLQNNALLSAMIGAGMGLATYVACRALEKTVQTASQQPAIARPVLPSADPAQLSVHPSFGKAAASSLQQDADNIQPPVDRKSQGSVKVFLDGRSLTPQQLVSIGYDLEGGYLVDLSPEAWVEVKAGRAVVDNVLAREEVVYGINTGFGKFANVVIPSDKLQELQVNLIRSHAAGTGAPLSPQRTRMLLLLRINVLAKGHSGVRPETVRLLLEALNRNCLSVVPAQGTVGASGDLAPLSHLALGMIGEGDMWDLPDPLQAGEEHKDGSGAAMMAVAGNPLGFVSAAELFKRRGLTPIELHAKEGLALINGTQLIASLGSEAVVRAQNCARTADCVAALTLEALKGTATAFHPLIHNARPHNGQRKVARVLRRLLNVGGTASQITSSHYNCGNVQDAYTLRCVPQIHGVVHDTLAFVDDLLNVELNSATDNPMIFSRVSKRLQSVEPIEVFRNWDRKGIEKRFRELTTVNDLEKLSKEELLQLIRRKNLNPAADPLTPPASAAEPVQDPLDKVAQRHQIQLVSEPEPGHNDEDEGGHSHGDLGHEHPHSPSHPHSPRAVGDGVVVSAGNFHGEYPAKACDYLAIAVHELASVSERRIERLTNPTLSGLPAFLVSEGGLNSGFMIAHCTAAALVSENKVLCHPSSIDSLSTSAAQEDHVSMGGFAARKALQVVEHVETVLAIELLAACQAIEFLRPLKSTKPLEAVLALVRSHVRSWDADRYMAPDIKIVTELVRSGKVWEACEPWVTG